MKRILFAFVVLAALVLYAHPALAQSQPTTTTLSSAEPNVQTCGGTCVISVASSTGITASTKSLQQFCLIDSELQEVVSISTTNVTVRRARQGFAAGHVSGALVICGVMGSFDPRTGNVTTVVGSPAVGASVTGATFVASLPVGTCTRSSQSVLPVFVMQPRPEGLNNSYGYMVDCLAYVNGNGARWVAGTLPEYPPNSALALAKTVEIGNVAYASLGTNSAGQANKEFSSSLYVPKSGYVTGIKFLCGGTCTTDSAVGLLRDPGGNIIANAAAAGVVLSGASTFQTQAFTAKALVVGPATYFCGIQLNGATAGDIQTIAASTWVDIIANVVTATFGTITGTITEPTTFTANTGPVCQLYY